MDGHPKQEPLVVDNENNNGLTLANRDKDEAPSDKKSPIVMVGEDETYGIPILYLYGPIELYNETSIALHDQTCSDHREAKGSFSMGLCPTDKDGFGVAIVWVNWLYSLDEALAIFIHEISHAVDHILDICGVDDRHFEAKAYFLEKETTRIMEKIYHQPVSERGVLLVKKCLKELSDRIEGDNGDVALSPGKDDGGEAHCEKNPPILLVGENEMFQVPIVYAYGPAELYNEIREKLFGGDLSGFNSVFNGMKGFCEFDRLNTDEDEVHVSFVWVNSYYSLEKCLPAFVHEISIAADKIMEHVDIADKTTEVRARIIGRETMRVLDQIYHKPLPFEKHPALLVEETLRDIIAKYCGEGDAGCFRRT